MEFDCLALEDTMEPFIQIFKWGLNGSDEFVRETWQVSVANFTGSQEYSGYTPIGWTIPSEYISLHFLTYSLYSHFQTILCIAYYSVYFTNSS